MADSVVFAMHIQPKMLCLDITNKTANHPKPPETTRNHPQTLTQNYLPPPSSPATSSKLHKTVKTIHIHVKIRRFCYGVGYRVVKI